jgi:hypothetical protein
MAVENQKVHLRDDEEEDGVINRFRIVGMRVLAVDDNPTCLKVLDQLLRQCQYHGLFLYFSCQNLVLQWVCQNHSDSRWITVILTYPL